MGVFSRFTAGVALAGLAAGFAPGAAATQCGEAVLQQMSAGPYLYRLSWKGMALEGKRQTERLDSGNWLAQSDSRLLFMGLEERTEFAFSGQRLSSIEYRYQRKGMSKKRDLRLEFDPSGSYQSFSPRGKAQVNASAPVYDLLNHQLQLQIDLACMPAREQYSYPVARRDKVDNFDYRRVAVESVQTPAGTFEAVRLERGDPKDFLDRVWLAPALNYTLVQMERLEDGEKAQLQLSRYPGQSGG